MRKIDVGLFSVNNSMTNIADDEGIRIASESEIEEGEIIDDDEDLDDFDVGVDLVDILTTPEGDTVCSALVALVQQIQTQNKILIKMLGKMG
jgi:hypothetical protein